jgi:hypothetical protein
MVPTVYQVLFQSYLYIFNFHNNPEIMLSSAFLKEIEVPRGGVIFP